MRIQLNIELGESSTWRARAGLAGLALALLAGGAGIAYAALPDPTFVAGEVLSASKLNKALPPIGTIIAYGGDVTGGAIPAGWVLCDGRPLQRTGTYARLFAVLGTAHGSADAATFNVPDLRGQFVRGVDNPTGGAPANVDKGVADRGRKVGAVGALGVGTTQGAELQAHQHGISDPGHSHGTSHWFTVGGGGSTPWGPPVGGSGRSGIPNDIATWGSYSAAHWFTVRSGQTGVTVDSAGGAETRPTNVALNYLIRAE